MPQAEPEYRTAYADGKGQICPETGIDLTNFTADGVRAHAENLFPGDPAKFGGDMARERKATLLKIAAEKDKA